MLRGKVMPADEPIVYGLAFKKLGAAPKVGTGETSEVLGDTMRRVKVDFRFKFAIDATLRAPRDRNPYTVRVGLLRCN